MATTLRVEVSYTVLDYKVVSIPPAPGIPRVPVIVPSALAGGIWSLRGPFVSATDVKSEGEYRSFVRYIVQARLGGTFDVDLLDSYSYPDMSPPPLWKLIPDAYNYTLMRDAAPYIEEKQGINAIAYIGYCVSVAPV